MNELYFDTAFGEVPIMGIFRGLGPRRTLALAEAAWSLGVRVVEVPVMNAEDLTTLRAVAEQGRARGLDVGAGTIVSPFQIDEVVKAGASFTVAPGLDCDVAEASVAAGLPHLPGVATGSEVQAASRLGFRWLKAFPAEQLGPKWIGHLHGPFPDVRFVAAGGITTANAMSFLDAGCHVVALGSAFETESAIAEMGAILSSTR